MRDKSLEESDAARFVSPTGHTQVPTVTPATTRTNREPTAKPVLPRRAGSGRADRVGPDRAGSQSIRPTPARLAGAASNRLRRGQAHGSPADLPHFWLCASPCLRAAWAPPVFS